MRNNLSMPTKRILLILLTMILPLMVFGQELKERRVYYLDCSYSMVKPNALWDKVRDNLINAIQNVNDEKTELIVIPFAKDNTPFSNNKLSPISAMADASGKAKLINAINTFTDPPKNTMTYLRDPLCDFYARRVAPAKVTYMFLMTDGQDEEKPESLFQNELRRWGSLFGDKYVYGFYVMLNDSAKNPAIEKIIDSQAHLWKVESADVNINLIRLHNKGVFNARNEKYFELPYYGDLSGKEITGKFAPEAPCQITKTENTGNRIRFHVKNTIDVHQMPPSSTHTLLISMKGGGKFDFLVTDIAQIEILSKPERSLKINMR